MTDIAPITSPTAALYELADTATRAARELEDAIAKGLAMVQSTVQQGGTLFFCGNGGSAADAQHMATEYMVRYMRDRRAYPAIAIEVQQALGIKGFGFDMNVACSSATFAIQSAADMVRAGSARAILIVNPEICSAHLEWRDRDCHFIFGDVCTAILIERADLATSANRYEIVSTRLITEFSNNIRNNNGFLRRTREGHMSDRRDMLFRQEGRKVFKQVVPMVAELILSHLADNGIKPDQLSRLWLHQANKGMNDFIGAKVLGRTPEPHEQPNILQDYANTSSAGSIVAFSKYSDDLKSGDLGVICSFGAGYSAGSVVVRKR